MTIRTQTKTLLCMGLFLILSIIVHPILAYANENELVISVTEDGDYQKLCVGDGGRFEVPETYYYYGEYVSIASAEFYSDNANILSVDESGTFSALSAGSAEVTISVYAKETPAQEDDIYKTKYDDDFFDDEDDYSSSETGTYLLFKTYYEFVIQPDLSNVTIDKNSQTLYVSDYNWNTPTFTFKLNSDVMLNGYDDGIDVTYTSSNNKIDVYGYLENNIITLIPYQTGQTSVTITINNKKFTVKIKTVRVNISKNSLLMSKKQVKQLKVKGVKSGIKWSSSNSKIASVSSVGKVKAKKNGNVVIKAKIGNVSVGCAVSVVSANRQKAIQRAIKIGKTCTYSQPKRMQANYYDCSSLVWKAYSKYGINFGNANYAPVAADQGKWCATHKKLVKGGLSLKNVTNMKLNAGDLMFETGTDNNRYRGIYHVEMISGYVCYGFDSKGKPILEIAWANRSAGKYYPSGQMVGRP